MTGFETGITVLTAVYVGMTGYYAIVSHKTLKAIEKQAKLTEDQAVSNSDQFTRELAAMSESRQQTAKLIEHASHQAEALLSAAEIAKENAMAAKAAADAALLNAQAIMNAERPWIIPRVRRVVKQIESLQMEEGVAKRYVKDVTYFYFQITNHGRTPAEVFAVRGRAYLTDKGINGGLEDPPEYGEETFLMHVRMLAPRERWNIPDYDLNIWSMAHEQMIEPIKSTKLHYIFKGVVLYRDVFKPELVHESRFCYTYFYMLDDYLPSGPHEHTKYT